MICNTRRCTSRPSLKAKWRKGSVLSMQWKLPHQVLPSFNSGGEVSQPLIQVLLLSHIQLVCQLWQRKLRLCQLSALPCNAPAQLCLKSSIKAVVAYRRMAHEYLHERFLRNLRVRVVQQALSLRVVQASLCILTVLSLDPDVAQHVFSLLSMSVALQQMANAT